MTKDREESADVSTEIVSKVNNVAALNTLHHADNKLLAELGYKAEFKREFSAIETIAFGFTIMGGAIASVASTFSFPLVSGGHVGMVFGWLIPSLFVLPIAACLAELASSMPTSAGLYYFSAKLAPPQWSALASWITGWANITGQVTLVCSIEFICAQMITTALAVGSDGSINLGDGPTFGILLGILLLHGIICSAATSVLARLNLFYAIIGIGTTIGTIIAPYVCSGDNKVSTRDAFKKFENNTGWKNDGWAFLLAFTAPMWTLTGYDSAAHISEETANESRAAPLALLISVFATAFLGWLAMIAASFTIVSVPALLETKLSLPMGQLFLDVLGKKGMLTVWSLIIMVEFVSGAAQLVDASRVVFAFARDGALPGSRYWRRINSYTQTPVHAAWLVVSIAGICGVLGFSEAALSSLAGMSVIGMYTSYITPITLRITSGRETFVRGPFNLGRWAVPLGVLSVAWVSFIIILLLFPSTQSVDASEMNYSVVVLMSVFIYAGLHWVLSARRWFTGPVKTIERGVDITTDAEEIVFDEKQ